MIKCVQVVVSEEIGQNGGDNQMQKMAASYAGVFHAVSGVMTETEMAEGREQRQCSTSTFLNRRQGF